MAGRMLFVVGSRRSVMVALVMRVRGRRAIG